MKKMLLLLTGLLLTACTEKKEPGEAISIARPKDSVALPVAGVKGFEGDKVPVLCYHAIREVLPTDGPDQKAYSVSPGNFAAQMRALAENGYTTVSPEDLRLYLTKKTPLPEKPIVITFDDGRKDQFSIAAPEMEKHGFKGVFYIMTVSLGRKNYMAKADVKTLSDKGHTIGLHTWDHHKVTGYKGDDWEIQIEKPKKMLEALIEKEVNSFAYPYGVWNIAAADSLKNRGFNTAFIFYGKQDPSRPMYTLERINGPNLSDMAKFLERIK